MTGPTHHKTFRAIVTFFGGFLVFLVLNGCMTQPEWKQAYSDEQLAIIKGQLEKWEQDDSYPEVKDIFGDGDDHLDLKEDLKEDWTPWDSMPDSFVDERAAQKAGGRFDYVKNMTNKTCLFRRTLGQSAYIFVYDQDATGKFVKSSVIAPPTWYSLASVEFVDVFGPGRPKFILIQHLSGHGTGFEEMTHWLLGWNNSAFRTVFWETVNLYSAGAGDSMFYRLNYKIVRGKTPRIETQSLYDVANATWLPYDFHSQWRDWFFWNEKDFSFYQRDIQEENARPTAGWGHEFKFRHELEKNRLKILKLPPLPKRGDIDETLDRYWDRIRID